MKKGFTVFLAVMVLAVISCVAINSEDANLVKIHRHAHAGNGDIHWQCRKCGMQTQYTGSNSFPSEFGCDVSRNGVHSWEKIYAGGSRSVHWQCVNCGLTTWTSSFPNEFGCSEGSGAYKRHVWQRQD